FGGANVAFNKGKLTPREQDGVQQDYFDHYEIPTVNGLLYPTAVIAVVAFACPVIISVYRIVNSKSIDSLNLSSVRRRALWIGDFAGWVGMALWVVSGIVFPLWHRMQFGDESFYSGTMFAKFLTSQIVTGWISSTLTFFLITGMFVRDYFPVLVRPEQSTAE